MIESIGLIWSRIPKKRLSSIVTFILGYLGKLALDYYVRDQPFKFSGLALPALLGSVVLLLAYYICAFVFFSVKMVSELSKTTLMPGLSHAMDVMPSPTRRVLSDSDVVIGTLTRESLAADIQAKIVLKETAIPDVQNFLKRISIGPPYCPNCSRPLDNIEADWRSPDISPVGYTCPNCRTSSSGHYDHVLKEGQALVRKDFEKLWKVYQSKIDGITNNRRDDFDVR